jgi:MFS family permease
MSTWFRGPSVAEERAEAVRKLVPSQPESAWRHYGLLLRVVFTVFAIIAVAAAFGFFAILQLPPKGLLTAALAIGTSEWLIRKHRFFRTGVESSLWLCGTFAFLFGLPSQGKVEALLAFAAVTALSGWRMRNAFFGVFAAILVVAYIAVKWDHTPILAMSAASFIAIASAFALRRVWQRPSNERLFAGLALAMPITGYLSTVFMHAFGTAFVMNLQVAAILGITAIVMLIAGIAWRDRVLLISATLSIACAAIELRQLFDYPAEAKLIGAGVLVIAIAVTLERALRRRTHGLVATKIETNPYDEAMQIGGIVAVAPHGSAPADHAHSGPALEDSASPTDKSFGGAGAGGGY